MYSSGLLRIYNQYCGFIKPNYLNAPWGFMPKTVTIEACLVDEADDVANEALNRQILDALDAYPTAFPWLKDVLKVKVTTVADLK